MNTTPQLDRARPEDITRLAAVVAAAFSSLAPSRWLVPEPEARDAMFPSYFGLYLELGVAEGTVYTTPERDAAAIWLPVSSASKPELPDYERRLAEVTDRWLDRFQVFDATLDEHHPEAAHQWLAILAVHPAEQGRGIGSALLRGSHQLLDREDTPAYLEASDPGTRELYLRHGYADRGGPIRLPEGPEMYPMWREPRRPGNGPVDPGR